MSNDANRILIILAAAVWIVLMAALIFVTWSASDRAIDGLRDAVQFLDDNNDNIGRLIVTLAALVTVVLALLLIIVDLAPEEDERELRVEQAGATTIVPAAALRQRLEEALAALPEVTAARARVNTRDRGITAALDVTVTPEANVAQVTQEATRVVVDTVQTDLGLPVSGVPTVRVAFGGPRPKPAASSMTQQPRPEEPAPAPHAAAAETVDERIAAGPAEPEGTAGSSPGPMTHEPETPQGGPSHQRLPQPGEDPAQAARPPGESRPGEDHRP
jgi:hypothetical protein